MHAGLVRALCVVVMSLAGADAGAAVDAADATHLVLKYRLPVTAAPAKAYAAAVAVARWWSREHTYSGDARNLHLDPRPGGCFCEALAGGGVEHMRVVAAMPGRLLRLRGGLGPLQSGALDGTLTFEFKSGDGGNAIAVSYLVSGYFEGGLDKMAGGVDAVLGTQLERLQRLIDTGRAEAAEAKSG